MKFILFIMLNFILLDGLFQITLQFLFNFQAIIVLLIIQNFYLMIK